MNTLLPTCDLNLDGTGLCPGHALYTEGAFPSSSDWCEGTHICRGCAELYWEGHITAAKVFDAFRYDDDPRHEESWRKRVEYCDVHASDRMKPYWNGYSEYLRSKLNVCIEHSATRKSVLEGRLKSTLELGPREFTFTYSPSWYESDSQAQNVMRLAVERLIKYYSHELLEFHCIGEYTDAGNSHIHGWYHLVGGRKITDKNFRRAYPHWNPKKKLGRGFEGGHHATIDRISDFAGYIEKHLEEAWLIKDINADQEDLPQEESDSGSSQEDSP